ncbi:hypothetical protein RHSIM_Rhsim12G0152500 [Rhododendron simsii]|uniref:Complex 1 LYR protein domain-containing protein n=1 Tax=Rhododendron simsii TaxID=118357 RepID=A0A834G2P6_RHOSS|nr:hypothetical protein RHSIM_Rhsim12G0152500 [Rhododendron simsii]
MAPALPPPGRSEVLSLLRSFLRTTRDFADYNIREYTKRRTIDAFRQNKDLSPLSAISDAFSDGESQLEVARRQAAVYTLYAPKHKPTSAATDVDTLRFRKLIKSPDFYIGLNWTAGYLSNRIVHLFSKSISTWLRRTVSNH